jgi:hypothetical protein
LIGASSKLGEASSKLDEASSKLGEAGEKSLLVNVSKPCGTVLKFNPWVAKEFTLL